MYHWFVTLLVQICVDDVIDDVTSSKNKSIFWNNGNKGYLCNYVAMATKFGFRFWLYRSAETLFVVISNIPKIDRYVQFDHRILI